MVASKPDNWAGIIKAVTTPLGFIVLGLLLLNAMIGAAATALTDFRVVLVVTLIGSIALLITLVVVLSIFRPEALQGLRPWQDLYPPKFSEDLYMALEGAFENLDNFERDEAWATLSDVLNSTRKDDKEYKKFCTQVAGRISQRVATKARLRESKRARAEQ